MKTKKNNFIIALVFIAIQANAQSTNTFIDQRDGREYKTIEVFGRIWMAENLRAEKFLNGDIIPFCKSEEEATQICEDKTPASYNFGYEETENEYVHGKLYNYYAITDKRGLCPEGWSVPEHNDYVYLLNYLWPTIQREENMPINEAVLDFNVQLGGWLWGCTGFWGYGNINGWWSFDGGGLTVDRYTRNEGQINVHLESNYSQKDAGYVRCIKNISAPNFVDSRDGKSYRFVHIGNQFWMADNLSFQTADSSSKLMQTSNPEMWFAFDDEHFSYGRLYEREVSGRVCPTGFRLPTVEDFEQLLSNLSESYVKLAKELMTNGNSGFDAVTGMYDLQGNFYPLQNATSWWAVSNESSEIPDLVFTLNNENDEAALKKIPKSNEDMYPIRCIKK